MTWQAVDGRVIAYAIGIVVCLVLLAIGLYPGPDRTQPRGRHVGRRWGR